MIERMALHNYGKHRVYRIVFTPITTLWGASAAGKSTILRALRWVAQNRPTGTGQMNWDSKDMGVRVWADGRVVERYRDKNVNIYRIDDGQPDAAVGSDVPDRVQALLGMGSVNFQGQFDAPYWISLSAPDVARALNTVINLDVIDRVLADLGAAHRTAAAALTAAETELGAADIALTELNFVPDMVADYAVLEAASTAAAVARRDANELNELLSEIRTARDHAATWAEIAGLAAVLRDEHAELLGLHTQATELRQIARQARECNRVMTRCPPAPPTPPVTGRATAEELRKLVADIRAREEEADRWHAEAENLRQEIRTESQGVCPVCGGKLRL